MAVGITHKAIVPSGGRYILTYADYIAGDQHEITGPIDFNSELLTNVKLGGAANFNSQLITGLKLGGAMDIAAQTIQGADAGTILKSPYAEWWRITQNNGGGLEIQDNKAAADGNYSMFSFQHTTDVSIRNINQFISHMSDATDTTIDSYFEFKISSNRNAGGNPNIAALKLGCVTAGAVPTATWASVIHIGMAMGADLDLVTHGLIGTNNVYTIGDTSHYYLGSYGLYRYGYESADPAAPGANSGVMYFRDQGGKTELVARFPTGAIQQIAIEP